MKKLGSKMEKENPSILNVSILVGTAENPELQAPLFGLFFLIYVNSFEWNLGTIMLTNKQQATNTYELFFLGIQLSLLLISQLLWGPEK
ncbi:hypothetical protein U0070_008567, partial [Myodes glareolus]